MCHIVGVGSGALFKEVDLSHTFLVVEPLVEQRGGRVAKQEIGVQIKSLFRRGVLGDLDVIDDAVNYLRLR